MRMMVLFSLVYEPKMFVICHIMERNWHINSKYIDIVEASKILKLRFLVEIVAVCCVWLVVVLLKQENET